jgi:hypothetical protein
LDTPDLFETDHYNLQETIKHNPVYHERALPSSAISRRRSDSPEGSTLNFCAFSLSLGFEPAQETLAPRFLGIMRAFLSCVRGLVHASGTEFPLRKQKL